MTIEQMICQLVHSEHQADLSEAGNYEFHKKR